MPASNETRTRGKAKVGEAAEHLVDEGKQFAHEVYESGLDKLHEVDQSAREYTDDLLKKVQKNPLAAVLIAGGIGFLLSALLRK